MPEERASPSWKCGLLLASLPRSCGCWAQVHWFCFLGPAPRQPAPWPWQVSSPLCPVPGFSAAGGGTRGDAPGHLDTERNRVFATCGLSPCLLRAVCGAPREMFLPRRKAFSSCQGDRIDTQTVESINYKNFLIRHKPRRYTGRGPGDR